MGGEEKPPSLENSRDVVRMLRERTMEGRLSSVIEALVSDGEFIYAFLSYFMVIFKSFPGGLISSHYNADAFLAESKNAAHLVAAARAFDNCDAKRLIDIRMEDKVEKEE